MRVLMLFCLFGIGCGSKKTAPPENNERLEVKLQAPNNGQPQDKPKAGQPWVPLPFPKQGEKPVVEQPKGNLVPIQQPMTNPNPNPVGVVQGVRGAVKRTVTVNEFNNLRLFIDTASLASGEMPTRDQIYEAVSSNMGDPKLAAAIQDGTILLTGTRSRESVWAYEKNALTVGGMVLKSDGIQRMTPQQTRQALQE